MNHQQDCVVSYELQCTSPTPLRPRPSLSRPLALLPWTSNLTSAQYQVFFVHHSNQRDWVLSVIERLESPPGSQFQCTCLDQIVSANNGISLHQAVARGLRSSSKTVFVLSAEFVADTWTCISDVKPIADINGAMIQRDSVVVVFSRCDVPNALFDCAYVDVSNCHVEQWWPTLVRHITRSDPQNGRLLLSIKSRCRCCGREVIDPSHLPTEFLAYGISIQADEYGHVIRHLMSDGKFIFHTWCYNVPIASLFFGVLFCLSVTLAPVIEERLMAERSNNVSRSTFKRTGLEFLHGIIVWLCVLAVYLITIYVAKTKAYLQESIGNFPEDYAGLSRKHYCEIDKTKSCGVNLIDETFAVDVESMSVQEDQRQVLSGLSTFTNDNLQVRYTGHLEKSQTDRQLMLRTDCREGCASIAFVNTGINLHLQFETNAWSNRREERIPTSEFVDFDREPGKVHLKSQFIMNGVCVVWRGWLDLFRLDGTARLEYDHERATIEDAMLGQQIEQYNEAISRLQYQRQHVSQPVVNASSVRATETAMEARDVAQVLLNISATQSSTTTACTTSTFR